MMNWSRSGKHFNSRPHGGRRKTGFSVSNSAGNFNSRPHGGRHTALLGDDKVLVISTHALTEGDTAPQQLQPNHSHFNSRPHGGRRSGYVSLTIPLYFNSRPHGGRQSLSQEIDVTKAFQLTPSRRATIWNADSFFLRKISTHALTEGDRIPADISILPVQISTHALTEGDGFCDTYPHFYNYHFNSRPHGGRPAEFWCFR